MGREGGPGAASAETSHPLSLSLRPAPLPSPSLLQVLILHPFIPPRPFFPLPLPPSLPAFLPLGCKVWTLVGVMSDLKES